MRHILVIDDDPDACRLLQRVLSHLGHSTECAVGGEAGWARLQNQIRPLPDLVILDVMMPELDGMEVLRRIRAHSRTQDLKVIIYSAVADLGYREYALSRGANDYWVKSHLSMQEMEARLSELLAVEAESSNSA